jgi:NTE family protein
MEQIKTKRKTVGLALGSGGFRGPAHIGVLKSLIKHNIPIDCIAGVSIGAVIGAHYAMYQDLDKMQKDYFSEQDKKMHYLKDVNFAKGLLSGARLEKSFAKMFDGKTFADTKIPFKAVATDLFSGEAVVLEKGDLSKAVRASVSIPLIFKPVKYLNKFFVDGGVSNPVPDNVVRKMGADIVISVNLYNKYQSENKMKNLSKILTRTSEIALYNLSISLGDSDIIINPNISKYSDYPMMQAYFSKKISAEIMDISEKKANAMIPEIKRLLEL